MQRVARKLLRRGCVKHDWRAVPNWECVSYDGNTNCVYPGWFLVPRRVQLCRGNKLQCRLLWGICVIHGWHVCGALPLRCGLLLCCGVVESCGRAVPSGLFLYLDGRCAAAMQSGLLLSSGHIKRDAGALRFGHVRCYDGPPVSFLLRDLLGGVLLPAHEHQRDGRAVHRQ